MVDRGPGAGEDGVPIADSQRRVRRSPLFFTGPLVLLAALVLILLWEIVRANVSPGARAEWPWRLQMMDMEALGSLLAVAAGAVLARAQYARTVRPYLGWRGAWREGLLADGEPAWRVGVLNGGQHIAVIEKWECRAVLRGAPVAESAAPWTDLAEAVEVLAAGGLTSGRDYRLIAFGPGFPLVGAGGYDTVEAGVFSRRCVERVEVLQIRVRVTDVVGDSHERVLDCMRGSRPADREPDEAP
ncbi:hypothetical protein [Streptomyces sp. YPW6]|uniref:hypothetical protein n=1 Tax=Streptomyces sp. YPW6 TaxID=2840373 RepID=UPI00209B8E1A|nr:hypothetical protein [Streptomyces sp. YPW6]